MWKISSAVMFVTEGTELAGAREVFCSLLLTVTYSMLVIVFFMSINVSLQSQQFHAVSLKVRENWILK